MCSFDEVSYNQERARHDKKFMMFKKNLSISTAVSVSGFGRSFIKVSELSISTPTGRCF